MELSDWCVTLSEPKNDFLGNRIIIKAEFCAVDDSGNLIFSSAGELKAMVSGLEWLMVERLSNQNVECDLEKY